MAEYKKIFEDDIFFKSEDGFRSEFMESFSSDLKKSLVTISNLLKEYEIKFVFIGEVARNVYADPIMTHDIDILMRDRDKKKLLDIPAELWKDLSHGYTRRFKLHDSKTEVYVVFEGDISGKTGGLFYPSPEMVKHEIQGLPFIDMKHFVMYNLSSGLYDGLRKHKDFADVVAVIESQKLPVDFMKGQRNDIEDEYRNLWYQVNG